MSHEDRLIVDHEVFQCEPNTASLRELASFDNVPASCCILGDRSFHTKMKGTKLLRQIFRYGIQDYHTNAMAFLKSKILSGQARCISA